MKKPYTSLIFSLMALTISACSNSAKHVVVAPVLFTQPHLALQNKTLSIAINDVRPAQHLLQVMQKDKAAELFSSQQALTTIIENSIKQAYQNAGSQVSANSNTHLDITLNQALINVEQELVKYHANSYLELSVSISNATDTLNKTYRSKGKSNGPLSADIAVLERDFNQQLATLINNIVTDPQLIEYFR